MTCSYQSTNAGLPPCLVFTHKNYKDLKNFLSDEISQINKSVLITNEINCISYDKSLNSIDINQDQCLSCGSCAFGCPGSKINFTAELKAIPSCSDFSGHSNKELIAIHDRLINLTEDVLDSCNSKYKSFEKFTGVKETTNISLWAGSTARYLFGNDAKIGLEIPLSIGGRDRNGRLDICVLTKSNLIIMEAKTGLKKMVAEGRFVAQILAYDEEISGLELEKRNRISSIKLLLIGDNENDLLPQTHEFCTSKVGNLSDTFYKAILTHGIQFISARGLLALAMSKLISPNNSIDNFFINAFKDQNTVGLLSNTLIKKNGHKIFQEPLSLNVDL
jgi:ferredoxin